MPIRAIARLIQTMLYARRFFPYYVYNILGGIEEDGAFVSYNLVIIGSACVYHQFYYHIGSGKSYEHLPHLALLKSRC
jgi:20S proteasome alpha/beta subunit